MLGVKDVGDMLDFDEQQVWRHAGCGTDAVVVALFRVVSVVAVATAGSVVRSLVSPCAGAFPLGTNVNKDASPSARHFAVEVEVSLQLVPSQFRFAPHWLLPSLSLTA